MLLAHAETLAEARSYLAALADNACTFDASLEYDRVLLELDALHRDDTPALYPITLTDRGLLWGLAESAIEELVEYGVDALQIELLLASLEDAQDLDVP